MLHELVFLGCHSQFESYRTHSHRICIVVKFFQPYVAATVRMNSDAVLSSTGALYMKTVKKKIVSNKWSTFASAGFGCRIHVNQPLNMIQFCSKNSIRHSENKDVM